MKYPVQYQLFPWLFNRALLLLGAIGTGWYLGERIGKVVKVGDLNTEFWAWLVALLFGAVASVLILYDLKLLRALRSCYKLGYEEHANVCELLSEEKLEHYRAVLADLPQSDSLVQDDPFVLAILRGFKAADTEAASQV